MSHRVLKSGVDDSMLGRWSWITLRGKNNIKTTFYCVYRPCHSTVTPNTTYSQHLRHLHLCNRSICPRDALLQDLSTHISKLQEEGHQIVVMGDFNEIVTGPRISQWAQELNLYEYVTQTFGDQIETYNNGSSPIDGIFISHSLQVSRGGYLPFGYIRSDHRLLWINLVEASVLGFHVPTPTKANGRKLQLLDP